MIQTNSQQQLPRHLPWKDCYNVRDVGGYPTLDGGQTRWGALVRADSLCRLEAPGVAALYEYGVRTVVDLRSGTELARAPHPFGGNGANGHGVAYVNVPVLDEADTAGMAAIARTPTTRELYAVMTERFRGGIAQAMQAIARAQEGGVLVHCYAGKDRTGVVVALSLSLAGVPDEVIAQDYALSDTYLQLMFEEILDGLGNDPAERARVATQLACPAESMLATLELLASRYGGVARYLLGAGVAEDDLASIRSKLRA